MAPEAGEDGWYGGFAEIAFKMSSTAPYFTAPREVARVQSVNVCDRVWPIQNQMYEFLQYGNGRMPKTYPYCGWPDQQVYSRNNVPVFVDPPLTTPYFIRIYASDSGDTAGVTRVLLQGNDPQGSTIYSQDGLNLVSGEFVTLSAPFATSTNTFLGMPTGIQKDITYGPIQFFWVDPLTGAQTLMLTMEPGEQTANYRRYYFNSLPPNCCQGQGPDRFVTVNALVKLELIPVTTDTDYCLIQSMEAIINEAEAVRYEGMDNVESGQMADRKHKKAVQLLNGQIAHYLGTDNPAIIFKPFGSASLARQKIGNLI